MTRPAVYLDVRNIHHTARIVRHPGAYAVAGALHGGMGLMELLLRMAIVWPALLCWWSIYYPFIWLPTFVVRDVRGNRARAAQAPPPVYGPHGRRIPTEAEMDRIVWQHNAANRARWAQPQAPYREPV